MKKFFTICVLSLIVVAAIGQERLTVSHNPHLKSIGKVDQRTFTEVPRINMPYTVAPSQRTAPLAVNEFFVGTSYQDLQSNSALSNRFYRYDNGHIVATWTGGQDYASFPDRGSFYNYFNGVEWEVDYKEVTRVEGERAGWPSYAPFGEGEALVSHSGTPTATKLYIRDKVNTGEWNAPIDVSTATWPRICVNDGTIHVLTMVQDDDNMGNDYLYNYFYYSRSKDGGQTWSPNQEKFELLGPDYYTEYVYSADSYVWAEPKNGVIAFAISGTYGDLLIMKSEDDGDTWEKNVVWENPIKFYDPNDQDDIKAQFGVDTLYAPNGALSLAIDDRGDCHMTFNVYKTFWGEDPEPGMYYMIYYTYAYYWNETMYPFTSGFYGLDPVSNPEHKEEGQLLLDRGFDFDGDGAWIIPGGGGVVYRNPGLINNTAIAMAGPNRLLIALELQVEENPYLEEWMYSKIFMCSYIYDAAADEWYFDTDWIHDPSMKSYDLDEEPPGSVVLDNYGWFRLIHPITHMLDNCVHPQIVVQESSTDEGNFYVFYQADEMPGTAVGSTASDRNPQFPTGGTATYTENFIYMAAESVDFSGPNFPENPIGIEEVNINKDLIVYPNPASNEIKVKVTEAGNCVIYNMTGQVVANQYLTEGTNTINIETLKSGVYFISAGNSNTKLVVE